ATSVRSASAVRPPRPMTRRRSSGCTRTSSNSPRDVSVELTVTSSGLSTIPLTRCSSASASFDNLLGGFLGRRVLRCGLVGRGLRGGLLGGSVRSRRLLGLRRLGRRVLRLRLLGGCLDLRLLLGDEHRLLLLVDLELGLRLGRADG